MLQAIPTSRMGLKSAHNVDDYNILVQLLKLILFIFKKAILYWSNKRFHFLLSLNIE